SGASATVSGTVLPRPTNPISPPAQLRAEAPRGTVFYNGSQEYSQIYLSWCRNPPQQLVTSYKVYRSTSSMGPYTSAIATLPASCMDGQHRCAILGNQQFDQVDACIGGATTNCCKKDVPGGNCKVIDTTVP